MKEIRVSRHVAHMVNAIRVRAGRGLKQVAHKSAWVNLGVSDTWSGQNDDGWGQWQSSVKLTEEYPYREVSTNVMEDLKLALDHWRFLRTLISG